MKPKSSIHSLALTLPSRRRGFSLIELMVALTIGLLLLAGLFYIYMNASQSFRVQSALALMQENARYAFELMGVDIRMAGFIGSQDTNPQNVVAIPQASHLCPLIDIFGDKPSGNKNCTDGAGPLIGYENTNPPNVCTTANTTPCYRTGTDSLTVVRTDTANKYAISAHTAGTSFTLATWPASSAPDAGEIFVAADYTHAAVFQVKSIDTGAKTVSYGGTGTVSPGNGVTAPNLDNSRFSSDIKALGLYRLSGVSYYIGRNPVGEPALYRDKLGHSGTTANSTAEELVQGVEDMEITYGVDTSADVPARDPLPGDGSVDGYWTAAQVNANTPNIQSTICETSTPNTYWKCVLSIRITLTLVSGQNEKVATTGDKLLRKTFTNTIAIRNRLPWP